MKLKIKIKIGSFKLISFILLMNGDGIIDVLKVLLGS